MPWQQRNQLVINRGLAIIQALPFTRGVALTGSLAEDRATEKSDIDFFVQVKEGRIWSIRFIISLIFIILGLFRTDQKKAGRICLNWYATFSAPAAQPGRVYQWLWQQDQPSQLKAFFEQLLSGYMGNSLENWLKKYQIKRIERDRRTHLPGSQVRYSDHELGFHPPKQK